MELDYKKLGKHIKEQRLKQHLTQEKLGEIVGVATIRESYTPFKRIFLYGLLFNTEKGFQMLLQNPSPD